MDSNYRIMKPLSNNVVVCEKNDNIYVLLGKGIGFGKKSGETIPKGTSIEQKFIRIDDVEKENYEKVLHNIEKDVLAVTEEIISLATERLGEELNSHIHVGLADHINFAIQRMELGIDIVNPFLNEIQTLYPKEYDIALRGVKLLKEKLCLDFPESEVGFITLHIYSARVNQAVTESLKHTRIVKEVVEYIQELLNIKIDEKSLEYSRLVSHLRYAIIRIQSGKALKNIILESIKEQMVDEFKVASKVCKFIGEKLEKDIPEDEVGYITLHINRINQSI